MLDMIKHEDGRRRFLINPEFQLSFLGYMFIFTAVTTAIFYLASIYFFFKFRQIGIAMYFPEDHAFFQFMEQQKKIMHWIYAFAALASFIVLSLSGLLLSHRVAGPIYRLQQHMKTVTQKKSLRNVTFRKKDYFQELAGTYNEQLEMMRKEKGIDESAV